MLIVLSFVNLMSCKQIKIVKKKIKINNNSYVWRLVFLHLGVSNSYVWEIVFFYLAVTFLSFEDKFSYV